MKREDVIKIINDSVSNLNPDEYELSGKEMTDWLCEEAEKRGLYEMAEGVCNEDGVPWCSIESVSYTHLDVYKRQVQTLELLLQ